MGRAGFVRLIDMREQCIRRIFHVIRAHGSCLLFRDDCLGGESIAYFWCAVIGDPIDAAFGCVT